MASDAVIGHFDVAGDDIGSLMGFYGRLSGWEVTPRGPGYAQLAAPGLSGAIVEASEASLTLGIVVSDLAATLAEVQAQGGSIDMPATDNGWVIKAKIRDPAGNLLTIIQK